MGATNELYTTYLLLVVAWVFGVGYRVDRRVVKVVDLLAGLLLHEPVKSQKP